MLATFAMPWGAWSISAGQLVAAGSIAIITAINYVGVRSGNLANTLLTAAKVAALVALPLLAIAYMRVDPVLTPVVPPGALRPLASFGVIMIAVMWTYEGWYYVAFSAGEIKDAARNVPRALIYGTLALTAIYVSVNLAYVYSLTLEEMSGVTRIAERAVTALVGPVGAALVAGSGRDLDLRMQCRRGHRRVAHVLCHGRRRAIFPAGRAGPPGVSHAAHRAAHHERLVGVPHAHRRLRGALHVRDVCVGPLRHARRRRHLRAARPATRRAAAVSCARISGDPGALRARVVRARLEYADGASHGVDCRPRAGGAGAAVLCGTRARGKG